ncbi:hypothetical protein ABW21_db0200823 [Orbilia brochopaga]|nr:hypothetical protein ABW21_db0200823 [Drechslerella brochopaga]
MSRSPDQRSSPSASAHGLNHDYDYDYNYDYDYDGSLDRLDIYAPLYPPHADSAATVKQRLSLASERPDPIFLAASLAPSRSRCVP